MSETLMSSLPSIAARCEAANTIRQEMELVLVRGGGEVEEGPGCKFEQYLKVIFLI